MVQINVIGAGYVGLVTAVGLAKLRCNVVVTDIDENKIALLRQSIPTIHEEGLSDLLKNAISDKKIRFQTTIEEADIYFICVGTPELADGSCDLSYFWTAVENLIKLGRNKGIIVTKSTVPVGTGEMLEDTLRIAGLSDVDVISNPEFLREGSAIHDFFHPDRIVIGGSNIDAIMRIQGLYNLLENYDNRQRSVTIHICDLASAELIKHASNSYLATRLSFINEIAVLCEKVGANVKSVATGIGLDARIGSTFLQPGPGWGGSCFPKDTNELLHLSKKKLAPLTIVESAIKSNNEHKSRLAKFICEEVLGDQTEKRRVAVLGLSFKANTDDVRESASIQMIEILTRSNIEVVAYDPAGLKNFETLGLVFEAASSVYDCVKNVDAVIIMTDWLQFSEADWRLCGRLMRGNKMYDLRNLLSKDKMLGFGFNYKGLGV